MSESIDVPSGCNGTFLFNETPVIMEIASRWNYELIEFLMERSYLHQLQTWWKYNSKLLQTGLIETIHVFFST